MRARSQPRCSRSRATTRSCRRSRQGRRRSRVVAKDASLYIAKDVPYAAWTFDGTIPGRALRVVEGDEIDFTLPIDPNAITAHSLDFHSAKTPPDVNYQTILPGEEFSWSFAPKYPGAFMYHCGTPPVLMHIGTGMYGAMIVDPKDGWPPAQELVFVQSDFYLMDGENGIKVPDYTKMLGNGAWTTSSSTATPTSTSRTRSWSRSASRSGSSSSTPGRTSGRASTSSARSSTAVCVNANPRNELFGLQSMTIGPGDGACVEFTLEEPGIYPAVNHAFGHAAHGAIALLQAE